MIKEVKHKWFPGPFPPFLGFLYFLKHKNYLKDKLGVKS